MGKSIKHMAIFHNYVKLPEGTYIDFIRVLYAGTSHDFRRGQALQFLANQKKCIDVAIYHRSVSYFAKSTSVVFFSTPMHDVFIHV